MHFYYFEYLNICTHREPNNKLTLKLNEKDQHALPGKYDDEPKFREGVPISHRPSPKRLESANLLARVGNVAGCAQTQHNTIMHAHVAMVWGQGGSSQTAKATPNTRNRFS